MREVREGRAKANHFEVHIETPRGIRVALKMDRGRGRGRGRGGGRGYGRGRGGSAPRAPPPPPRPSASSSAAAPPRALGKRPRGDADDLDDDGAWVAGETDDAEDGVERDAAVAEEEEEEEEEEREEEKEEEIAQARPRKRDASADALGDDLGTLAGPSAGATTTLAQSEAERAEAKRKRRKTERLRKQVRVRPRLDRRGWGGSGTDAGASVRRTVAGEEEPVHAGRGQAADRAAARGAAGGVRVGPLQADGQGVAHRPRARAPRDQRSGWEAEAERRAAERRSAEGRGP